MEMKISFEQARLDHLGWMHKMRDLLDGKVELVESEIVSHLQCRLGKWFESEGRDEFGELEELQKFDVKHIKLHKLAKEIYIENKLGNKAIAEELFTDLSNTSQEIVTLLNEAETKLNIGLTKVVEREIPIKLLDDAAPWDKSNTLVIKILPNNEIEYVNAFFTEVSSFENKDLMGKNFNSILHPDIPKAIERLILENNKEAERTTKILKFVTYNGKFVWAVADFIPTIVDDKIVDITVKLSGVNNAILAKFIIPLYEEIKIIEAKKGESGGILFLNNFLEERNRTMDEYIQNLIITGRDSIKSAEKRSWFGKLFNFNL
ncbi:CZB domain-containing protein [Flavobacterium columnare]|uniref:Chemoreceptor zinc-binding domain-containing protein n=1 Tax=Flavobacterium columnare TaxID=996 RepID=A0AAI8CI71_9FLAO|nr:CZB domain-containing protein [Flavobacterium columnare]AMO20454.1 hypothetical protein UN65_09005 [Flavobacterium columnare]AUX18416.1 hypothetical protein AQ623_09140 [Flavobacterium columnare]QOG57501.1 CZB domain-containing protein [Flavobacterium columnare]QOG60225.1 CZB domain-containing protein [Flavobacterium columnare]QOG62945.1 CZB domain-containing protein [Flavobacterium columnare]